MDLKDMSLDELIELKERLLEKRKELENKARKVYDYWDEIDDKFFESEKTEEAQKKINLEKEKINKRLDQIYDEIHKLGLDKVEAEIWIKKPPVATNNIIDLRKGSIAFAPIKEEVITGMYDIYLHNTNTYIGCIMYSGYHCHNIYRDVGFQINKEYRGHGYAYQALTLLSNLLYKKGINDFWITVDKDNIPSIKTIKKYGGKLLKEYKSGLLENPAILDFECKTRKIEFENENNIQNNIRSKNGK